MASLLSSATEMAHHAAVSLLSSSEVKVGSTIPTSVPVKENEADKTFTFKGISGKNLFIGVPGAFTGTCSAQIPGYIRHYDKFKEKGIDNIYVVAVNDVFVLKAWKDSMTDGAGTPIHFIADDKGAFVGALGMLFDATERLGAPRSKRFVLVTEGDTITELAVEPVTSGLTVTAADKILPLL
ncbi:Redoxin [Laetiporus sulphureus 93-53]|uniref:Redoxin n=1 Tax=Laetiporus sulphureus 93-53 TaxID=1314785 RepID=A0A165BUK4_9APHY|nr:Redoxin [Laetiporus sulphureus 93-53]KZT01681.1 Redoxin [Laetiporus sulphureus 93-53]